MSAVDMMATKGLIYSESALFLQPSHTSRTAQKHSSSTAMLSQIRKLQLAAINYQRRDCDVSEIGKLYYA